MPSAFPLPARLSNSSFPLPLTKPGLREDCAITVELLAAVVSTFSVDGGTFATVAAMRPVATVAASGRPAGAGTRAPAFFFDSKIIMQLRSYLQQT